MIKTKNVSVEEPEVYNAKRTLLKGKNPEDEKDVVNPVCVQGRASEPRPGGFMK